MEQFQVSIGICIRNCEKTIDRVIHSIIQQDYPHKLMELIVVDDGSTDMTFNHVKRLTSKIGIYMKVYRQNWKGLGAARNIVVRNAKGKYIIWVDGDMELPKDHVRKQVEFMEKNPKVGAAKARYKSLNSAKNVVILENSRAFHFRSENSNIVGTGGSIYRVKAIREIGGFDERIRGAGEDIDALLRMRERGWVLARTDAEFYEHFRESWRDLWSEYYWWGYGAHFVKHKHKGKISVIRRLPLASFLIAIVRFLYIFKSDRKLIYLLLPFHSLFKDSAWIFGFIRSHYNGYGHIVNKK
ncbi:MAG: glycosyltransferase [Candidatus Heimdallarchaeaceae archaeon]